MKTTETPSSASSSEAVTTSVVGQRDVGEIGLVLAALPHGGRQVGRAHPEGRRVGGAHDGGHRRPPRSGPDHRHPVAHAESLRRLSPADGPYTDTVSRTTAPVSEWALPTAALGPSVVLIPVKAFSQAKRRLGYRPARAGPGAPGPLHGHPRADRLHAAARRRGLRRRRGGAVGLGPRGGSHVGARAGAQRGGTGRRAAPGRGRDRMGHGGPRRPAPCPRPGGAAGFDGVTLVPDRRDDGTNVLRLPARATDFCFAYGPGSFRAHRAEAMRIGLAVRVVRNPNLAYDVDWPADVDELIRTTAPRRPLLSAVRRGDGGPKAPVLRCSVRNEASSASSPPCGPEPDARPSWPERASSSPCEREPAWRPSWRERASWSPCVPEPA